MKSRIKYVDVSAQIIAEILKMAASNALPLDAKVMRVNYNILTDNFQLVVESKEFDEIPEGSLIPKHADPVVSQDFIDILRGKNKS